MFGSDSGSAVSSQPSRQPRGKWDRNEGDMTVLCLSAESWALSEPSQGRRVLGVLGDELFLHP